MWCCVCGPLSDWKAAVSSVTPEACQSRSGFPFKIRFKADSSHDRWAAKAALTLPRSMNVSSGYTEPLLRKQESKRKWLAGRASRLKQDLHCSTEVTRDQFEQVIINKRRCRCQQPPFFVVVSCFFQRDGDRQKNKQQRRSLLGAGRGHFLLEGCNQCASWHGSICSCETTRVITSFGWIFTLCVV